PARAKFPFLIATVDVVDSLRHSLGRFFGAGLPLVIRIETDEKDFDHRRPCGHARTADLADRADGFCADPGPARQRRRRKGARRKAAADHHGYHDAGHGWVGGGARAARERRDQGHPDIGRDGAVSRLRSQDLSRSRMQWLHRQAIHFSGAARKSARADPRGEHDVSALTEDSVTFLTIVDDLNVTQVWRCPCLYRIKPGLSFNVCAKKAIKPFSPAVACVTCCSTSRRRITTSPPARGPKICSVFFLRRFPSAHSSASSW